MIRKDYLVIIALVIIILVMGAMLISNLGSDIKAPQTYRETIANTSSDPGTVEVIRNIGNPDGEKIAYVVGVHPLEHLTHETLIRLLLNASDLHYCYDLYIINVTDDVGFYGDGLDNYENPGRQNGQDLAYKYVFPAILKGNYKLAVDVHSNIGAYPFKTFVFSPVKEGPSVEYASEVAKNSKNITYYSPDTTTSGPYLTVPLNENGTPSFYFEEWSFAPQEIKDFHIMELINAVDNL